MKTKRIAVFLLALCALLAPPAWAAEVGTLDALKTALAGTDSTVTLTADITVTETLNVTRALTLDGNGHKLTGNGSVRILKCTADATIKNLTITGGVVNSTANSKANGYGGAGLYVEDASPTITGCIFENNQYTSDTVSVSDGHMEWANGGGLAIAATQSGAYTPAVTDCTFKGNSAYGYGGGMYTHSAATSAVLKPTVTNCTFEDNTAFNGGGMYNGTIDTKILAEEQNGEIDITVTNCTFKGNKTADGNKGNWYDGGGMANFAIHSGGKLTTTVTGCTFDSNEACIGGGLYNWCREACVLKVTVKDCTFTGNKAVAAKDGTKAFGGSGGGIWNGTANSQTNAELTKGNDLTVTVENCTFKGNTADTNGAGICNEAVGGPVTSTVTNCRFEGNEIRNTAPDGANPNAQTYGAGMFDSAYADKLTSMVENCTFTGNKAAAVTGVETLGGGLMLRDDGDSKLTSTVTNSTFTDNTATYGGGVCGYNVTKDTAKVVNCTFVSNTATAAEGGAEIYSTTGTLNLVNTILWNEKTPCVNTYNGGSLTLTNCAYGAGATTLTGTDCVTDLSWSGRASASETVNDVEQTYFKLTNADASLIRGGAGSGAPSVDQLGRARNANAPSIGAFEYIPSSAFTPITITLTQGTNTKAFEVTVAPAASADLGGKTLSSLAYTDVSAQEAATAINFTGTTGGATVTWAVTPANMAKVFDSDGNAAASLAVPSSGSNTYRLAAVNDPSDPSYFYAVDITVYAPAEDPVEEGTTLDLGDDDSVTVTTVADAPKLTKYATSEDFKSAPAYVGLNLTSEQKDAPVIFASSQDIPPFEAETEKLENVYQDIKKNLEDDKGLKNTNNAKEKLAVVFVPFTAVNEGVHVIGLGKPKGLNKGDKPYVYVRKLDEADVKTAATDTDTGASDTGEPAVLLDTEGNVVDGKEYDGTSELNVAAYLEGGTTYNQYITVEETSVKSPTSNNGSGGCDAGLGGGLLGLALLGGAALLKRW
ncbi:MAG: hypothetical protein IJ702_02105 [Fretibacterium sp.]|nr:hypothetical protein [Fretibacterium sp.]